MQYQKKIWTLQEAKKVFPTVYKITEEFYYKVENLKNLLNDILPENQMEKIEEKIGKEIQLWMLTMMEIGVEVKGLWLIDFDNGKGYYCWKYDEKDILYEHDYHSGFKGRKLIQNSNDNSKEEV